MTATATATATATRGLGDGRRSWRDVRALPVEAVVVAAVASTLTVVLRWRGGDFPAAIFRIDLFRRSGFSIWDVEWYGGHHLPGYSILLPPIGAALGASGTAAVAGVVATGFFADVARRRFASVALAASLLFATGTIVDLAVGRVAFALGVAFGMAAFAIGLDRSRARVGAVLAAATSLASPVAGAFLALVAVTAAASEPRRWRSGAALVGAGAIAPLVLIGLQFPEGGRFPFRGAALAGVLACCAGLALVLPALPRVRLALGSYALVAVVVFVIPNPMGGNVTRLLTLIGPPLALVGLGSRRRSLAVALLVALVWWQWSPAVDAVLRAGRDPSVDRAFFAPIAGALRDAGAGPGQRIEIVPTAHHWEAAYLPPSFALARGWERQLDLRYNSVLYDDRLDAEQLHRWLRDNAVTFVVLADVPLDFSARREAAIVRAAPAWLAPVAAASGWRVFRVSDPGPMIDGGARFVGVQDEAFVFDIPAGGSYVARVRYSAHLSAGPAVCLTPTSDGWVRIGVAEARRVTLRPVLSAGDAGCDAAVRRS